MAQKKSHEVDSWLARPDPRARIVLVYGPDRGLVSERAALYAAKTGLALDDVFSVIRYDASELEQDPGRLLDEARMVPMFGGERLLWIRNAGAHKGLADAIKELVGAPPADAVVLIEAGDLKKTAPLRGIAEAAAAAMALPCFADEERSVDALLDSELARADMSISPDARRALRRRLGGDRLATRGEIEKLILYCIGKELIDLEDVEASSGDVSGASVDLAIDAVLSGALADLDHALQRFIESGTHPQVVLGAAMRQFQGLEMMRRAVDFAGAQPGVAVSAARPPVFFGRKKLVENAVGAWTGAAIARALSRLQDTVLQTRRRPDLSAAIVRQSLLAIAIEGMRLQRRR